MRADEARAARDEDSALHIFNINELFSFLI